MDFVNKPLLLLLLLLLLIYLLLNLMSGTLQVAIYLENQYNKEI